MRFRSQLPSIALLSLALLASATHSTTAQQTLSSDASVGTLIVAHGGGPAWDGQVVVLAREVKLAGPVGVGFLMGPGAKTHRFQDVVQDLIGRGAKRIIVVPMLVSSHSGHYDQIRYLAGELDTLDSGMLHHLHASGIERPRSAVPLTVARAMDDAPEIAEALAARALALTHASAGRALFVVGHGPNSAEDYAAWMANLRRVADSVRVRTGFRSVLVDLVRDDAPAPVRAEAVARIREMIRLQHELTGEKVIVVPALVATGRVSREKLAKDLAGLPAVYTGQALLPHPAVARWIEARVHASVPANP